MLTVKYYIHLNEENKIQNIFRIDSSGHIECVCVHACVRVCGKTQKVTKHGKNVANTRLRVE